MDTLKRIGSGQSRLVIALSFAIPTFALGHGAARAQQPLPSNTPTPSKTPTPTATNTPIQPPLPPGVYTFRGGQTGVDGSCEGVIRQTLGLLDPNGKPVDPIPTDQQITDGARAVGFMNKAKTGRGYDLQLTTFDAAFRALRAGDSLYMCGHGQTDGNGSKGGRIQLDRGTYFNGFIAPGFPEGTKASRSSRPYPQLPAPAGAVAANIHHCWSGRDPDGGGPEHAVSETLGAIGNVAVKHAHQDASVTGFTEEAIDGPAPGDATAAQIAAAEAALASAAHAAGFRNPDSDVPDWLDSLPFAQRYPTGQRTIDAAVPPLGTPPQSVVSLRLVYSDLGDAGDPPGARAAVRRGCTLSETFPNSRARVTIFGPSRSETATLIGPSEAFIDIGDVLDRDGNGREEVDTELAGLRLAEIFPIPDGIVLTLRSSDQSPFQRSTGKIEEAENQQLQILDLPPFNPDGAPALSVFDAFFEFREQGQTFHNNEALHLATVIKSAPPAEGDTYRSISGLLLDEDGNDTGLHVLVNYSPNPWPCDVNVDGVVDRNDIQIILAARNTWVASGDPRDRDGNRLITVNDARICTLECTNPLCAP